jgi:broad specificity phosphatase PhoE
VYLIRHGATRENRARVLIGQTDPPLADESRAHLRSIRFPIKPEAIYSSPLRRAAETASLLFHGQAVTLNPDLMERGFGDFEGRPLASLIKNEDGRTTYTHWDEETLVRNHGEPIQELESRISRFKGTLMAAEARTIAVVSHGTLIAYMVRVFFGEASRRASPANLHVVCFRLHGDGAVTDLVYDVPIDEMQAASLHE